MSPLVTTVFDMYGKEISVGILSFMFSENNTYVLLIYMPATID
jgi:hypothetical protein